MKPFFATLAFLSIVPVPERWRGGVDALARGLACFPLIGLLLGAMALLLDRALGLLMTPIAAAALLVIALMAISGGLHMDGLADTADGFFSARGRERILEIMRDSRTGSMGAAAVASVLLVKFAAVASLPAPARGGAVLLMPLAGRCAQVFVMSWLPYARPEGGLASVFGAPSRWHVSWSATVLAAAAWIAAGWHGVAAAAAAVCAAVLLSLWSRSKIGGFTGDTLGATTEIVEAIPPLVLASTLWPGGLP